MEHSVNPQATPVAAGSIILSARKAQLVGIQVTSGATAGYLMLFDQATVPADGTVTPVKCWIVPANSSPLIRIGVPLQFQNGIVAVFSSTGPFSKTLSATAFISGDVLD